MMPREAIRPLVRRAMTEDLAPDPSDPMEALVALCERLLPLPPLETWLEDVMRNPEAHLNDVEASADAPTAEAPVTLETRSFSVGSEAWSAHLRSFRDGEAWRGFIAFEGPPPGPVHRTALIFMEPDPVDLRERFLSFGPTSLVAFLRSALP